MSAGVDLAVGLLLLVLGALLPPAACTAARSDPTRCG
jgi:hypothetical protein